MKVRDGAQMRTGAGTCRILETLVITIFMRITGNQFKGKPAARRGRKASGLKVDDLQMAGLPAGSVVYAAVIHSLFADQVITPTVGHAF